MSRSISDLINGEAIHNNWRKMLRISQHLKKESANSLVSYDEMVKKLKRWPHIKSFSENLSKDFRGRPKKDLQKFSIVCTSLMSRGSGYMKN